MSSDTENPRFIYEPLRFYQEELRDRHTTTVGEFFEELVRYSGVNAAENAATVGALDARAAQLKQVTALSERKIFRRRVAVFFAVMDFPIIAALAAMDMETLPLPVIMRVPFGAVCAVTMIFLFAKVVPELSKQITQMDSHKVLLKENIAGLTAEGLRQMEPLNKLYKWDTAPRLFSQTLPLVSMDAWFDSGRMDFLSRRFNFPPPDEDTSTLAVQSGELQGNPFVFISTVRMRMETETYFGTKYISWTEWQTDSKGHSHLVTRSEVLIASVSAPKPFYTERTRLFYGNDAAPDLSFSRPAGNAHKWSEQQRKSEIASGERRLEAMTRDAIKNGGAFLDMTNKEFDVLFNALNRNHQQQFRLLFTPLAQKEMTRLLTDGAIGFGDDFGFIKAGRLNILAPAHLQELNFMPTPDHWRHHSLEGARRRFNDYHNDYFRRIYFAFAPLLAIPLYQQHRPPEHIYQKTWANRLASPEREAAANSLDANLFAHPESATRNILKARATAADDRSESLMITAHGFAAEPRLTYVSRFGGDGLMHDVPVHWTEYIPVTRESTLHIEHPRDTVETAPPPPRAHHYKDFKLTL